MCTIHASSVTSSNLAKNGRILAERYQDVKKPNVVLSKIEKRRIIETRLTDELLDEAMRRTRLEIAGIPLTRIAEIIKNTLAPEEIDALVRDLSV